MFLRKAHIGQNDFWRYAVTILLVIAAAVVGGLPLIAVMIAKSVSGEVDEDALQEAMQSSDFSGLGIEPNLFLVLMLLQFVAVFFVLWLLIVKLHKKPLNAVLTGRSKLDWSRVWVGFGVWFALMAVSEGISFALDPGNYELQFNLAAFLPLVLIALTLLPIQTSAEELLMRGYLMQGISLISKYRWIPLVITSLVFGLLHGANPEVEKYGFGIMMVGYISIGLTLGIMTLMDDGLELALGVHAANNIFGALFLTFDGSVLSTPAIFKVKEIDPVAGNIAGVVMCIIFLFIMSRMFNWDNWKDKLFGEIEQPEDGIVEEEVIV